MKEKSETWEGKAEHYYYNHKVSLAHNWTYSVSFWAQNHKYGSASFLGPEADIMGQFLGPETDTFPQFLGAIVFSRILANRKRKNNLNMFWIMYDFNRNKKNPFEQILAHFKVFWAQKLI